MEIQAGIPGSTQVRRNTPAVAFGRQAAQPSSGSTSEAVANAVMTQSAQAFFNQPLAQSAASNPKLTSLMDDLGKLGIDADTLNKLDFGTILKLLSSGDIGAVLELVKKYKDVLVEGMMSVSDLSPYNANRTPEQRELQRKQLEVSISGGIAAIQIGLMIESGNYLGAAKCAFENREALVELAKQGFNTSLIGMLYKYLVKPGQTEQSPQNAVAGLMNANGAPNTLGRMLLAQSPILAFAKSTYDQAKAANAVSADRFSVAA